MATSGRMGKRYVHALSLKGHMAPGGDADLLARAFGLTDPDTLPEEPGTVSA